MLMCTHIHTHANKEEKIRVKIFAMYFQMSGFLLALAFSGIQQVTVLSAPWCSLWVCEVTLSAQEVSPFVNPNCSCYRTELCPLSRWHMGKQSDHWSPLGVDSGPEAQEDSGLNVIIFKFSHL